MTDPRDSSKQKIRDLHFSSTITKDKEDKNGLSVCLSNRNNMTNLRENSYVYCDTSIQNNCGQLN